MVALVLIKSCGTANTETKKVFIVMVILKKKTSQDLRKDKLNGKWS